MAEEGNTNSCIVKSLESKVFKLGITLGLLNHSLRRSSQYVHFLQYCQCNLFEHLTWQTKVIITSRKSVNSFVTLGRKFQFSKHCDCKGIYFIIIRFKQLFPFHSVDHWGYKFTLIKEMTVPHKMQRNKCVNAASRMAQVPHPLHEPHTYSYCLIEKVKVGKSSFENVTLHSTLMQMFTKYHEVRPEDKKVIN